MNISLEQIVRRYTPLVKNISYQIYKRLPAHVQYEDILQTGMIGLIEASKMYDETKGASFATYASIRIRGAILDALREYEWTPRSVQHNIQQISKATNTVQAAAGRKARAHEIAKHMHVSLQQYHLMLQECYVARVCELNDFDTRDEHFNPQDMTQDADAWEKITAAINRLPKREREVLLLYYQQELNLKQIGSTLAVSESRACQLHHQAINHLKTKVAALA